jgi:hypothetical protein
VLPPERRPRRAGPQGPTLFADLRSARIMLRLAGIEEWRALARRPVPRVEAQPVVLPQIGKLAAEVIDGTLADRLFDDLTTQIRHARTDRARKDRLQIRRWSA